MSRNIAVVFDFDDTLVPDSTTILLKQHGIDPDAFWNEDLKALVAQGYDATLGYLRLLIDNVGEGKPLGLLTNQQLREFGGTLDKHFYPGIPEVFEELSGIVKNYPGLSISFHIISGGLQPVIEGSAVVQKYFAGVYGCVLDEAGDPPAVRYIKRAINFTEKTRYLFEINKGLSSKQTQKNPYLVNKRVPKAKRSVPMSNMVYIGDGLTDIPCFSLLNEAGGMCFGVFDPADNSKAKRAFLEFLKPKRVVSMHSPRYGRDQDLGSLLGAAVSSLCNRIVIRQRTTGSGQSTDE